MVSTEEVHLTGLISTHSRQFPVLAAFLLDLGTLEHIGDITHFTKIEGLLAETKHTIFLGNPPKLQNLLAFGKAVVCSEQDIQYTDAMRQVFLDAQEGFTGRILHAFSSHLDFSSEILDGF